MAIANYHSHIAALETAVSRFSSAPAFKVPAKVDNGVGQTWTNITYQAFLQDVRTVAKYWLKTLSAAGFPLRSTIGLWVTGWSYSDIVTIYALSMADYIPQLFSLRLPNPKIIFELLARAGGVALIYDNALAVNMTGCPVPKYVTVPPSPGMVERVSAISLPKLTVHVGAEDILMILHTSGSTSGSPKLVPLTRKWIAGNLAKAWHISQPKRQGVRDVTTWLGSICHVAQTFFFFGFMQHGAATLIPSRPGFSSEELINMINTCGLNRLNQIPSFLITHIKNARTNSTLLQKMKGLGEILYCALDLPREYEDWAYGNGLPIRNAFGSTECGGTLVTAGGNHPLARYLHALPGTSYEFKIVETTASGKKIMEFVVKSSSPDCPHARYRAADGHYHTGDLFEEVQPGYYVFKGRNDDWIKTETGLRCDTRSIEDNVRSTCKDLMVDCVVVGTGRPWPALVVESSVGKDHQARLKAEITKRMQPVQAKRYLHEQIRSDGILVINPGSLPRTATKGNVRRQAAELAFKKALDEIYEASES